MNTLVHDTTDLVTFLSFLIYIKTEYPNCLVLSLTLKINYKGETDLVPQSAEGRERLVCTAKMFAY